MLNSTNFEWFKNEIEKKALELARIFAESDFKPMDCVFINDQINDVAATPLPSNKCIKVTIEYSDILEKEGE